MYTSQEYAIRAHTRLLEFDSVVLRDMITDTFVASGDIPVWNAIFDGDADMLKRFAENAYRIKDHMLIEDD